ncbi:unnamed protein product [Strongylus vulgaris]|uniref:Uncharacterized protein n=1 Tax=Strongylus vulgaris TaxID=40348 RepID=A0A3P7L7D7_STRVU|nr:unnamed protein product [Strongylus vulgaris]
MRVLVALCIFIWTTNAQNEDAGTLLQSILDVDRSLAEEIKKDISLASQKEKQLRDEFAKSLNNSVQRIKDVLGQRVDKLRDIEEGYKAEELAQKQQATMEWETLMNGINSTKALLQEEREREMDQQKQILRRAWDEAKVKLDEIQSRLNDSADVKKERRKEMLLSMRSTMDEIRAIMNQEEAARKQQQQQRRAEFENRLNQIKSDIMARKDDLDAREQEIRDKYAELTQKQAELKESIQARFSFLKYLYEKDSFRTRC